MSFIVTGGHSPIAIAISKNLSKRSSVFHLTRKSDETLQSAFANHANIILEEWDLERTDDCLEKLKRLLILENIEGIIFAHRYRSERVEPITQYVIEVETPFQLLRHYCENYTGQNGSAVILTSPAGESVVPDQSFNYHASKAALSQLVKYAAIHFKEKGVRTNGISPGAFIEKERSRKFYEANIERLEEIKAFIPLRRLGTADEIANLVSYLCSENSSYINGVIIKIDGGYSNMEPSYTL
jgi:NAD(P)-dependent dehydrogenase (short-subunit alcohol dehydrogenase family)